VTGLSGPILDVRLHHRVHSALVLDVSIKLGHEIGVLFGASGAGKTTVLRLIAGLHTPESGRIDLDHATLFDSQAGLVRPLRDRRISMIFQDDCLFPHLSISDNIRFGLKSWRREQAHARLMEVAALCGVEHLLNRRPETLSGGERQRVGLARALAPRPRLLLCDEPVSALDLVNRRSLLERLGAAQRKEKIPILYVTHSPAEAVALGSRLFLLKHGRIAAEGPPLLVLAAEENLAPGRTAWDDIRNIFPASVAAHFPEEGTSRVTLDGGPDLIVPLVDQSPGTRIKVEIRAEDIILARRPLGGISARNQVEGTVERIIPHGLDAEAIVRTESVTWIVSLMSPVIDQLELVPGAAVHLIVKARGCHVFYDEFWYIGRD
jgi:molybdate transport system ATP-binding protein